MSDVPNNEFTLGEMPDEDKSFLQKEIERLNNANTALVQEFTEGVNDDTTDELPANAVRKELSHAAIAAVKTIQKLAQFGDSESVQFSASKYILDIVLGNKGGMDAGDAKFAKLLNDLFDKPAKGADKSPTPTDTEGDS